MNLIKVITRKIPKQHVYRADIIDFSNILTQKAQQQSGFISSESYWEQPNDNILQNHTATLYTISNWENIGCWNSWLHSDQRLQHMKSYEIIDSTKHQILYK